jgi:glycosyltransferase involved in cell wall biosynthesis
MAALTVSAVIPTRNRPSSLHRLLRALAAQDRPPEEVIVADASDEPLDGSALAAAYPGLALSCFHMVPSLCTQRNRAIARATGSHVLMCDDDIEPGPRYLRRLVEYLDLHPQAGVVSGLVCDPEAVATSSGGYPAPSFRHLMYGFVFQLGLGADLEAVTPPRLVAPVLAWLQRWYRRRGNTWSLAGWPLVTHVRRPAVYASVGVLGAALVRRSWLLQSPYDERLDRRDAHAIGDNYGVALGFPGVETIAVLTDLPIAHHRAPENRLDRSTAYYERVLALHYFMRRSGRFSTANIVWLAWSLIGNALMFLRHGQTDLVRVSARALATIAFHRNPLLAPALDLPAAGKGEV